MRTGIVVDKCRCQKQQPDPLQQQNKLKTENLPNVKPLPSRRFLQNFAIAFFCAFVGSFTGIRQTPLFLTIETKNS